MTTPRIPNNKTINPINNRDIVKCDVVKTVKNLIPENEDVKESPIIACWLLEIKLTPFD